MNRRELGGGKVDKEGGGGHDASHVMRLDFTKQSRGLTHMRGVDNGRREAK